MTPDQERQKKEARKHAHHHLKHGANYHPFEAAKNWLHEQKAVEQEYLAGKGEKGSRLEPGEEPGEATREALKKGKQYHPFSGFTY